MKNSQHNFTFQLIKVVLFNQFLTYAVAYLLSFNGNFLGLQVTRELPSFSKVMLDLIVCMFCYEIFFYYTHRLLHHKSIYKMIHKVHHEYQTPIGISAIYCHPIEHLLSNIIPVVIGFPLMKCHPVTALLWLNIVIVTTINDHSGYHLPFLHSSELHDYHHLK